jgi:hypothetical protein
MIGSNADFMLCYHDIYLLLKSSREITSEAQNAFTTDFAKKWHLQLWHFSTYVGYCVYNYEEIFLSLKLTRLFDFTALALLLISLYRPQVLTAT